MSDYYNMVKDNCHMLLRPRTYYYYYVKNGGLEVNLCRKNLGNEEATQIAKALMDPHTNVQTLRLCDNNIGDEGAIALADQLKSNSTLKSLELHNCGCFLGNKDPCNIIGVEGALAIAEALKSNSTLVSLELSNVYGYLVHYNHQGNKIEVEGALAIAEALKLNSTLQTLGLQSNNIGVDGATAIAHALKSNSTLKDLWLGHNNIGVEGARAIAMALGVNLALQTLDLSKNNIGCEGTMAIAMALSVNSALQTIDLSNNKIGDEGATALAVALKVNSNSTLQQLELRDNNIEDEGATAVAEALKSNSSLQELGLEDNFIGDVGATAMAEAIKKNATLESLILRSNNISEALRIQLNIQLPSLLSSKYRDKRRLEISRSKLSVDSAKAVPMISMFTPMTLQPLSQQPQFSEIHYGVDSPSSTRIAIDRTNIQKVVVDYEATPVELSWDFLECAFGGKVSSGVGAFGEVFWVQDDVMKTQYGVKTMRLGLDDEQRKFDKETFRAEIQMLQRFRHPNIVRMYGYHISADVGGPHYLLFEFASQGSLESMLKTEEGRKVLTFPRRLGILHGVAQGLHFLHTGIQLDPNRPSMEMYAAFHCDVKSVNICITSTFGAKLQLIDCGLGNISRSAQLSSDGGNPVVTPRYRDPGYEHKDYDNGSFCDVFSFGLVMAEVFTGILSATCGDASDTHTIYRKYVHVSKKQEKPPRELRKDVDDLITDAPATLLDQLCMMSLECLDEERDERPSPLEIMARLQEMIVKVHCGHTWTRTSSGDTGGARLPGGECCCICQEPTTLGLSCSDHFICAEHLPLHNGISSGQDPFECIMEGCRQCYREDEIQKCLPAAMYKHYVQCQGLHANYLRTFAKMYPIEFSNRLERKVDVALDGIPYLDKKSDRALIALAHLVTGEQTPCPKLVWIVPQKRIVQDGGTKDMKDLFKDSFFQETAVYFLCETTYSKGHEDPILMNFSHKWTKHLLPLVKLSLLTLKLTAAVTPDLPFPILGVGRLEQLQYLEDLVSEESMQFLQATQDTLQDMETWFCEIVEKGESMMEGTRVARIKNLISSSYEMLSQKALQEENLSKWKPTMTAQIGYDDNGTKCKIKWVKLL
jgi:Ran GTPase-activating protein (RanGAP) involved in mRNA processing and transport/serine/threonine protein kinase